MYLYISVLQLKRLYDFGLSTTIGILDSSITNNDALGFGSKILVLFWLWVLLQQFVMTKLQHLPWIRWHQAKVEYSNEIFQLFKSAIYPHCSLLHPWGVENNISIGIDVLKWCYRDQKGKQFRIWIDRTCPLKISLDIWLVILISENQ